MTASDNEWQRVVQRVTTNRTTSDNKWEWMTTSVSEWQWVIISANVPFFRITHEPNAKLFKPWRGPWSGPIELGTYLAKQAPKKKHKQ